MLTRLLTAMALAITLVFAGPAWSYDTAMAESYAKLFAPVKGAKAGKGLHLIKPDAFVDKVKAKEPLVVLDVRTPAESGVYGSTLPGTLAIPINELFTEANLARIPTDKTVVVLCLSGARAVAAGTALRHIGFEDVYVLKGGFKALVPYMSAKKANTPPRARVPSEAMHAPVPEETPAAQVPASPKMPATDAGMDQRPGDPGAPAYGRRGWQEPVRPYYPGGYGGGYVPPPARYQNPWVPTPPPGAEAGKK